MNDLLRAAEDALRWCRLCLGAGIYTDHGEVGESPYCQPLRRAIAAASRHQHDDAAVRKVAAFAVQAHAAATGIDTAVKEDKGVALVRAHDAYVREKVAIIALPPALRAQLLQEAQE